MLYTLIVGVHVLSTVKVGDQVTFDAVRPQVAGGRRRVVLVPVTGVVREVKVSARVGDFVAIVEAPVAEPVPKPVVIRQAARQGAVSNLKRVLSLLDDVDNPDQLASIRRSVEDALTLLTNGAQS
jgi:ribosomal protein S17